MTPEFTLVVSAYNLRRQDSDSGGMAKGLPGGLLMAVNLVYWVFYQVLDGPLKNRA